MVSRLTRAAGLIVFAAGLVACGGSVESGSGPDPSPGATAAAPPACRAESWAERLVAPIAPPRRAADLDLAGPNGGGLTLAALGALTCGSVHADATSDKPTASVPLGPEGALFVHYDTGTLRVVILTMTAGYSGALAFGGGGAGSSLYRVAIGAPITKDGAPFVLEWQSASFHDRVDELHRALVATFAPEAAPGAGGPTGCVESGACVVGAVGEEGFVTFASIGTTIWVASTTGAQPRPSTPSRIDQRAPM